VAPTALIYPDPQPDSNYNPPPPLLIYILVYEHPMENHDIQAKNYTDPLIFLEVTLLAVEIPWELNPTSRKPGITGQMQAAACTISSGNHRHVKFCADVPASLAILSGH